MSAEDRTAIAAAANSVSGVNVTPYFRQSGRPGDGFLRLAHRDRSDNGFGWVDTYQIWIAISQDVKTAELWLDANVPNMCAALDRELVITSITPTELVLDTSSVNGVIFEGSRGAGS